MLFRSKHKDQDFLHQKSIEFADGLRKKLGNRVVGPHQPLIGRIKNLWLKRILIKVEKEVSTSQVKAIFRQQISEFYKSQANHSTAIVVDVDPV